MGDPTCLDCLTGLLPGLLAGEQARSGGAGRHEDRSGRRPEARSGGAGRPEAGSGGAGRPEASRHLGSPHMEQGVVPPRWYFRWSLGFKCCFRGLL